jgi:hypothetical protein
LKAVVLAAADQQIFEAAIEIAIDDLFDIGPPETLLQEKYLSYIPTKISTCRDEISMVAGSTQRRGIAGMAGIAIFL